MKATGGREVVVKRGVPVAPAPSRKKKLFGFMTGEFKIVGDIESSVIPSRGWKTKKK